MPPSHSRLIYCNFILQNLIHAQCTHDNIVTELREDHLNDEDEDRIMAYNRKISECKYIITTQNKEEELNVKCWVKRHHDHEQQ